MILRPNSDPRPKKVVFFNQKGGVGKTTTCRDIGIWVARQGYSLLFADGDSQGNLTKSLFEISGPVPGLYEAIEGGVVNLIDIDDSISLLAGDFRLSNLEKSLIGEIDSYTRLKDLLASEIFSRFDFVFIDCPPSLGVLSINALAAADHLVIPMRPSLYSMQGTNDLMAAIMKVRKTLNPNLNLLGVIINGFDSLPVITRQIRAEIEASFGDKVFQTALSETIRFEEAIAAKKGIVDLKRFEHSKAREELSRIGSELLLRLGGGEA